MHEVVMIIMILFQQLHIGQCVGSPLELPLSYYSSGCARLIGNAHPR